VPTAGEPPTRIARLTESDWKQFARLRLRALTDTYGTADGQYLAEARFTAADWRRRLRENVQFAALVAGRPVGLVAAHQDSADTVYLYSLWLDPDVRGRGLAHELVSTVLDWARRHGARTVTLRVAPENRTAWAVYERVGFAEVPAGPPGSEVQMAVTIG